MDDDRESPGILASDAEREHSVSILRDAVVAGRLTLEEFSDRVGRAQSARTDRDLVVLTSDLPATAAVIPAQAPVKHRAAFSRLVRSGAWELPPSSDWRCWFGTIVLDLREARLAGAESEIRVFNLFGTVTVTVPPGVIVEVAGGGAFASQVIQPPPWPAPAGAPRLRITVSGPGGTLYVRAPAPAQRELGSESGSPSELPG
jgi:DUF1707 SHOCT-like domain